MNRETNIGKLTPVKLWDKALIMGGLPEKKSVTENMPIHGCVKHFDSSDHLHYYGSDAVKIKKMINKNKHLGERIVNDYSYLKAEILWAVRNEMARNVEDFLARRIRFLLLDARASIQAAPVVAKLMAEESGYGKEWVRYQTDQYTELAKEYFL